MVDFSVEATFRGQRFEAAAKGLQAYAKALQKDWDGAAVLLADELRQYLTGVAEALATRHGGAYPGGTTDNTLSRRSGDLVAGILGSVEVTGTTWSTINGKIGAPFPAQVHEYGATIHKKDKWLTIPLPAALDSRGVPLKRSAREWQNTFVAKSRAGNLIIFQKDGAKIVPLYVLKESVTIKPRLGMGETVQTGVPYFTEQACDRIVKELTAA